MKKPTKPDNIKIRITRKTCINGVDVQKGQVVNAPFADAKLLIAIDKAEMFREEGSESSGSSSIVKYTMAELEERDMKDLQKIGKPLDVKDNKKDDLVLKILEAQEAR